MPRTDRTSTRTKGRPRRVEGETASREEHKRLQKLIAEHRGNLSAMARAEGVTRPAMTKRLRAAELEEEAAAARFAGGVSGTRSPVVGPESAAAQDERAAIVAALEREPSAIAAAKSLGLSRSALNRRIAAYQIERPGA